MLSDHDDALGSLRFPSSPGSPSSPSSLNSNDSHRDPRRRAFETPNKTRQLQPTSISCETLKCTRNIFCIHKYIDGPDADDSEIDLQCDEVMLATDCLLDLTSAGCNLCRPKQNTAHISTREVDHVSEYLMLVVDQLAATRRENQRLIHTNRALTADKITRENDRRRPDASITSRLTRRMNITVVGPSAPSRQNLPQAPPRLTKVTTWTMGGMQNGRWSATSKTTRRQMVFCGDPRMNSNTSLTHVPCTQPDRDTRAASDDAQHATEVDASLASPASPRETEPISLVSPASPRETEPIRRSSRKRRRSKKLVQSKASQDLEWCPGQQSIYGPVQKRQRPSDVSSVSTRVDQLPVQDGVVDASVSARTTSAERRYQPMSQLGVPVTSPLFDQMMTRCNIDPSSISRRVRFGDLLGNRQTVSFEME